MITRGPERADEFGDLPHATIGAKQADYAMAFSPGGALDFRDWQLQRPGDPTPLPLRWVRIRRNTRRRYAGARRALK